MPLSTTELTNLKNHAINPLDPTVKHPSLITWIDSSDWTNISNWYSETPFPSLNELMTWMTFQDRVNFYNLGRKQANFQDWYSELCQIFVVQNNPTSILSNYPPIAKNEEQIKQTAIDVINEINAHKEAQNNFTVVVQNMFKRSAGGNQQTLKALQDLLVCLCIDGTFEDYTCLIYSVELSPYARWQTLGLTSTPTPSEVEIALT